MKHWIRYTAFVIVSAGTNLLPRCWVAAAGEWLGALAGTLGVQKAVIDANLAIAFGRSTTTAARDALRRSFMRHAGRSIGELLVLPRFDKASLSACIAVNGLEAVRRALDEGRGALLIGGHYGNWEYHIAALGMLLEPRLFGFSGEQQNPMFDGHMNRLRASFGVTPIPASERATRDLARALKARHALAITADSDYPRDCHFAGFFGKLAATATGAAAVALKSGCPCFFSWCQRTGPFRFTIGIRPLEFRPTGRLQEDIAALTGAHLKMLEQVIAADPAQYLWSYKRWRTRPQDDPEPVYPRRRPAARAMD